MKTIFLAAAAIGAFAAVPAAAQPAAPPPADGPMAPREMGPVTRAAFQQRLRAHFAKLDVNHDGFVDRTEADARMGRMRGGAADAGPRPMRARRAGMHMGFGGRWFDRLDANHDGRVSLAEADTAAAAMFDRMDVNHDGTITPDERGAARQRFRQRMDAPREQ